MKKLLSVVLLSTLGTSLLLSGCGMFRSHKDWQHAQQESPLEIPPGLDTPATADALMIPQPGANQPTASGTRAQLPTTPQSDPAHAQAAANSQDIVTDGFVISGTLDSAYAEVGHALAKGDLGVVRQHDKEAHSYILDVMGSAVAPRVRRGFFGRMFHRDNYRTVVDKNAADEPSANYPVTVSVGVSGTQGSQVEVQGQQDAVARVIDGLRKRLNIVE